MERLNSLMNPKQHSSASKNAKEILANRGPTHQLLGENKGSVLNNPRRLSHTKKPTYEENEISNFLNPNLMNSSIEKLSGH